MLAFDGFRERSVCGHTGLAPRASKAKEPAADEATGSFDFAQIIIPVRVRLILFAGHKY